MTYERSLSLNRSLVGELSFFIDVHYNQLFISCRCLTLMICNHWVVFTWMNYSFRESTAYHQKRVTNLILPHEKQLSALVCSCWVSVVVTSVHFHSKFWIFRTKFNFIVWRKEARCNLRTSCGSAYTDTWSFWRADYKFVALKDKFLNTNSTALLILFLYVLVHLAERDRNNTLVRVNKQAIDSDMDLKTRLKKQGTVFISVVVVSYILIMFSPFSIDRIKQRGNDAWLCSFNVKIRKKNIEWK